jgi:transposase
MYKATVNWEFKTSTLRYNRQKDTFYLHVVIHKLSPEPVGDKVLGIDRGIVNIAVTSNNRFFNSKPIKETGKDILSSVLSVVFKYMLTSMLPGILPFSVYPETVGCL